MNESQYEIEDIVLCAPPYMMLANLEKNRTKFMKPFCWLFVTLCLFLNAGLALAQVTNQVIKSEIDSGARERRRQAIALYNCSIQPLVNGDYQTALPMLEKAVQLCPDEPLIQCNYGAALVKAGQIDTAIIHFLKATTYDNCPPVCWANLGSAYELTGQKEEAISSFKKYLDLHPAEKDAERVRGHIKLLKKGAIGSKYSSEEDNYFAEATAKYQTRWSLYKMPLKVYVSPGEDVAGYKTEYQSILERAFKDWADASDGRIKFEFTDEKREADITVRWTDDINELANRAEGGDTKYHSDAGGLHNVAITLLTTDPSASAKLTLNTVRWLCLHEIGHALGLIGHSPLQGDIMYFCSPLVEHEPALSQRDIKTLSKLYSADINPHGFISGGMTISHQQEIHLAMCAANNEGLRAFKDGKEELAIRDFKEALKLEPDAVAPMRNLIRAEYMFGTRLMKEGNLQDAEEHLMAALKLEDKAHNADLPVIVESTEKLLRLMHKNEEAEQIKLKYDRH